MLYRLGGGGGGAYAIKENFENMVQFGACWCIDDQIVS